VRSARTAPTPASNVDELLAENAGHESIEMLSGEYRELLARFLAGETVASQSITLPPARFRAP
jgi:hypothetical protein